MLAGRKKILVVLLATFDKTKTRKHVLCFLIRGSNGQMEVYERRKGHVLERFTISTVTHSAATDNLFKTN